MKKGYIWSINSSTWNYLQALWQGTPLDLLRSVYRHQDRSEAGGYISPTWRIRFKTGSRARPSRHHVTSWGVTSERVLFIGTQFSILYTYPSVCVYYCST